jgi:hypothetical protein
MKFDQDHSQENIEKMIEEQTQAAEIQQDVAGKESSGVHQKKPHKEHSQVFVEFMRSLSETSNPEEKVRACISFMKDSLTHTPNPKFRDFWDVRKFCLPIFKETMSPKARSDLWQEYTDVSAEARRLKDVLDEQSAFAYEQIDLAIQALTKDLESYEQLVTQVNPILIPDACSTMLHRKNEYIEDQSHLTLLNSFASKINSLRKEVIRTEMRIKNKNKLFERLSAAGDCVFPKRKVLIKNISEQFSQDVESFVTKNFQDADQQPGHLHQLREEIKALQNIAKELTLNAQSFNDTRVRLSECWDKLKVLDKERKKEISQKKQQMRLQADQVMEKIKTFSSFCQEFPPMAEVQKQFEEIVTFMKSLELNFSEQKMLKDELYKARKPVLDKERHEQEEKALKDREVESLKKEKIEQFKTSLASFVSSCDALDLEVANEQRNALLVQSQQLSISKADKMLVDRSFKQIKDKMDEMKSRSLLSMSDSDKEKLDDLIAMLEERKKRRQEIRGQIESYRKVLGGSGFDFEKAMMYRELIEAEKETLENINAAIEELEEKVADIEGC